MAESGTLARRQATALLRSLLDPSDAHSNQSSAGQTRAGWVFCAGSMDVRIAEATSDHVLGERERVVLAIWRGTMTLPALRRAEQLLDQQDQRHPGQLLLLTVLEATACLPTLVARAALVALLQRSGGKIERSAWVIEGEGVRAAGMRAVLAGASLFARPMYPNRVFNSVAAAVRFLSDGKDGSPVPELLLRMVQEARRRVGRSAFVPWPCAPDAQKSAATPEVMRSGAMPVLAPVYGKP